MKAIIVPAMSGPKIVDFEMGESYNLIQSTVGGHFDCISINSLGADVWIHDEGKLIGLPVNFKVGVNEGFDDINDIIL